MALQDIIILQNKLDLMREDAARSNYKDIQVSLPLSPLACLFSTDLANLANPLSRNSSATPLPKRPPLSPSAHS